MLIIGEKINSTRKAIDRAIRTKNPEVIQAETIAQAKAGADMLDVNCGTLNADTEPSAMEWLVTTMQKAAQLPLCIDSPNPKALETGLAVHRGKAMINSISGERERYKKILPLIKEYQTFVIALCLDDNGIPQNKERAIEVGRIVVGNLLEAGIPIDDIYFDPLVRSLATSPETVVETLVLMEKLAGQFEGLHFVSGLSNVSFGLPGRRHLNRAYLVLSIASGLDAVIMDPLDRTAVSLIYATEAMMDKDRFCMKYIQAHHQGELRVNS